MGFEIASSWLCCVELNVISFANQNTSCKQLTRPLGRNLRVLSNYVPTVVGLLFEHFAIIS